MQDPNRSLAEAVTRSLDSATPTARDGDILRRIAAWNFDGTPPEVTVSGTGDRSLFAQVIVEYVAGALDDHHLSVEEQERIRRLKNALGIREGEVVTLARNEVEDLLNAELGLILRDENVDSAEALHQVELQRAFDLGYDDYQSLIRRSIEPTVAQITREYTEGGVSLERRDAMFAKLRRLDTFVPINPAT